MWFLRYMFFFVCSVQGPGPGAEHNDPNSYSLRKTGSSLRLEPEFENHVLFFVAKNREECALRMEGMGIPLRMASCHSFSISLHCTHGSPCKMTGPGWGFCVGLPDTKGAIVRSVPGEKSSPALIFQGAHHHRRQHFPLPTSRSIC